jgi:hypothetical protein
VRLVVLAIVVTAVSRNINPSGWSAISSSSSSSSSFLSTASWQLILPRSGLQFLGRFAGLNGTRASEFLRQTTPYLVANGGSVRLATLMEEAGLLDEGRFQGGIAVERQLEIQILLVRMDEIEASLAHQDYLNLRRLNS